MSLKYWCVDQLKVAEFCGTCRSEQEVVVLCMLDVHTLVL